MMLNVRLGHTALTWNVLAEPARLAEAIRDCAALGYAGTETGGRVYDWWERERPGALKQVLADAGVTMACLFQAGDWLDPAAAPTLLAEGQRLAAAVAGLGGEVLMLVPGRRRETPPYGLDDFARMAETMNRVGQAARAHGVKAAMHPHWGTAVETRLEIEVLLDRLDPRYVGFAPDTGQIAKGGADPLPIVARWADRVWHVHVKDLAPEWEELRRAGVPLRSPEGYTEVGQGVLDFAPLVAILAQVDYAGWLMAELDESSRPPGEAARLSKQALDRLLVT